MESLRFQGKSMLSGLWARNWARKWVSWSHATGPTSPTPQNLLGSSPVSNPGAPLPFLKLFYLVFRTPTLRTRA